MSGHADRKQTRPLEVVPPGKKPTPPNRRPDSGTPGAPAAPHRPPNALGLFIPEDTE